MLENSGMCQMAYVTGTERQKVPKQAHQTRPRRFCFNSDSGSQLPRLTVLMLDIPSVGEQHDMSLAI